MLELKIFFCWLTPSLSKFFTVKFANAHLLFMYNGEPGRCKIASNLARTYEVNPATICSQTKIRPNTVFALMFFWLGSDFGTLNNYSVNSCILSSNGVVIFIILYPIGAEVNEEKQRNLLGPTRHKSWKDTDRWGQPKIRPGETKTVTIRKDLELNWIFLSWQISAMERNSNKSIDGS